MLGQNNKQDPNKRWKNTWLTIRNVLNATAVVALLLPNMMAVGVAVAEELPTEEPPTEEVAPVVDNFPEETPTPPADEIEAETPAAENTETTQQWTDPTEVLTLINVNTPQNMTNYVNTLQDFENHPLILTNQVTGETFRTSIQPNDGNTSNNFQLATTVHAYERGNQPSGRYSITLPQELIDLGYSLTRDHSVQSNFGIVGMTNLSYNAPQSTENTGELARNVSDYDYLTGRDLGITLTTLDGQRTYTLGSRNLSLPSGEYNIRITNSPSDTRPQLLIRESSLVNAPEREIELTREGDAYVGTATLDFTNSTRPQIFKLSPVPLEVTHTVTIDPNGGTIDEDFLVTEVDDGDTYTVPYGFQSGLARTGYTLTGYTVEGTLLDRNGNPVTEISQFTGTYTPMTDVTLTANWEVTSGTFIIRDSIPNFIVDTRSFALTDGENTYPLTSRSYTNLYREWRVENIPNGTYTLLVDGIPYPEEWNFEKAGQPDTVSDVTINNGVPTFDLTFEDDDSNTFIRYRLSMNVYDIGVEVRDLNNRRTADVGILVEDEAGTVFEGSFDQYNLWTTNNELPVGNYTITLTTPEGTVAEINDTVASQTAVATDEENVFTLEVNAENKGNLSRVFGAFRLIEVQATHPLGIEVRDLNNRRTADVGINVTNEEGTVFEGSFDQYLLWTSTEQLLEGSYTITLTTPEGTVAEINDTVASQAAVATDEDNVFTIEVNETTQGNLSRVFGAFRLVKVEEPAPETDADRYEPVFVDEIVLDLNRGNGKLKNPKTLIENMNQMPGGIKVDYTNLDQIDLSGKTSETQLVEITVTYRDGSTDVAKVPLQVIPKETPQRPGKPIVQKIVKTVVKAVKTVVSIIGSLFGRWF